MTSPAQFVFETAQNSGVDIDRAAHRRLTVRFVADKREAGKRFAVAMLSDAIAEIARKRAADVIATAEYHRYCGDITDPRD